MGCTEAEWLRWLPAAIGDHTWQRMHDSARVCIAGREQTQGTLQLTWSVGSARKIALVALPRLHVNFQFEGLDDAQRYTFMRRFDLYMQRGGG